MSVQTSKKILMIDDKLENMGSFHNFLIKQQFNTLVAPSGKDGLRIATQNSTDIGLILLDINMPKMDGYETCRRLKSDARTAPVPIIFMSARDASEDKILGLHLGAVDYITKPIEHEEALARIETHLELHELRRQLEENVKVLEQKNEQLETANAELDAFAGMVAHDLKTPLGTQLVALDMIKSTASECPEVIEYADYIGSSSQQMADIIDALLLLARVSRESVQMGWVDMSSIFNNVHLSLQSLFETHHAHIDFPESWPSTQVWGYAPWVEEIWRNYIVNALTYGGKPPVITVGVSVKEGVVEYSVQDNGEGISEADQAHLFIPFKQLHKQRGQGHGLGLSIVQRIAERLNGEVGVDSRLGEGSRFHFTLPSRSPDGNTD